MLGASSWGAAAQELLVPPTPWSGDAVELDPSVLPPQGDPALAEPALEPIRAGQPVTGVEGVELAPCTVDGQSYFESMPALLESSGTWLQRGFWYAEVDALLLNRQWDKRGLRLASESITGEVPNDSIGGTTVPRIVTDVGNELKVAAGKPGMEGMPRVTLGMFLFRDGENRDHATEFTWFGAGEFVQRGELQAVTTLGLQVNDFVDRSSALLNGTGFVGNPSFDSAQSMDYYYNHTIDSFEWNYLVKRRMRKDRMVLRPSGEWVREANPTRTLTYLAGVRYLNLREELNWTADGIRDSTNANARTAAGFYDVDVDNNLLGTQIGFVSGFETGRWSISGSFKAGAYWNSIDLNSQFTIDGTNAQIGAGNTTADVDNLAFVGQGALQAKWHLRPNASLRAGLELLWIDSIAVAPFNLNFIPGSYPSVSAAADSVFMGASIGWEGYW
jgi:hypothetical protein